LLRVRIISSEDTDFVNTLSYVKEHIFIFRIIQRKKLKLIRRALNKGKSNFEKNIWIGCLHISIANFLEIKINSIIMFIILNVLYINKF
jgi:hypothetical protein